MAVRPKKIDERDDPVVRISELTAQTVLLFVQDNLPQIMTALNTRLRAEYGGEQVHFGKGKAARVMERNAAIRRDALPRDQGGLGLSIRALARKWHLSKSQIVNVLKSQESFSTNGSGKEVR